MRITSQLAKAQLADMSRFSAMILGVALRRYQLRPLRPVLKSILFREGREFLLVFPRQSGKNEAVAQLLVYLLNVLAMKGGNVVFGATGDALGRGILRLEQRLDNDWNRDEWRKGARPARRTLGKAAVIFLSTYPGAASRGETAHWLLVIDELQEQDPGHIEAVFEPMRAANNATALYIGTVKSTHDALWLKKQELEALEAADGRRRVFVVYPDEVVAEVPAYGRFLANKVARFGRHHPTIASEYFNEPVNGAGRLFDERRIALMRGTHRRAEPAARDAAAAVVATLDVGGQDEGATAPGARLHRPGRDYTVAHVFAVESPAAGDLRPIYRALDVFVDQGSRHFQDMPGRPKLAERLLAWLQGWQAAHLVADQSGIGAGLVDWLAAQLGPERVTGFTFSGAHKAALGAAFLSLVETGRFRYWTGDEETPLADGWWFFAQARACVYSLPAGGLFERDLRWAVPDSARIGTPAGMEAIHDDRLISAALVAEYDQLLRQSRARLGQAASAVIRPRDALDPGLLQF